MNKQCHRVVFNRRRGQWIAVAETASAHGAGSTSTSSAGDRPAPGPADAPAAAPSALSGRPCQAAALAVLAALASLLPVAAGAQIVADPHAPGGQRATVLAAPNGVPVVNVQTPSAAGVSRNTYSQFDVQRAGAILNNSRGNVQTQLGGWVQGNPWMATGSARVIVNEVNSANPSVLRGYVEVAGPRAEVIVANPAGIQVDGAGFINASGVTLTTGTPLMNAGSLEGFRVERGQVDLQGLGLDARTADFAAIYARALQVNAGIWSNQLTAVTGANVVMPAAAGVAPQATPMDTSATASAFALDVGVLGGMYAGRIHLIGTEAGLGVNMQGTLAAQAGPLVLQANGQLTNSGTIAAGAAGQDVTIRTQGLANSGTLASQNNVVLDAGPGAIANSGTVNAARELIASAGVIDNRGTLTGGRLQLAATNLANVGRIEQSGSQALAITASDVSNTGASARIGAQAAAGSGSAGAGDPPASTPIDPASPTTSTGGGSTQTVDVPPPPTPLADGSIQAGTLVNAGGQITANGAIALTSTRSLTNSGTVRVDSLSARGNLDNSGGTLHARSLDIDAGALSNRNGSIGTDGDSLLRGATLDNSSGRIEAAGNLSIATGAYVNAAGTTQAGGTLTLEAAQIDNTQGSFYAGADATVTAGGAIVSSGSIGAAGNLAIAAQSLDSTGTLAAGVRQDGTLGRAGDLSIATAGDLRAGGITLAAGRASLQGASVDLSGSTTSAANLSVRATAGDVRTRGATIAAVSQLDVTAAQALDNAGGSIQSNGLLTVSAANVSNQAGQIATATSAALDVAVVQALDNTDGTIAAGAGLNLQAGGIDNTRGRITAANGLAVSVAGALTNASGTVGAQGALHVQSRSVDNTQGTLDGRTGLDVAAQTVSSSGTITSGMDARIQATLANTGLVQAESNLDIAGAVSNSGRLIAGGTATLTGALSNTGLVQAAAALAIDTQGADLVNGGSQGIVSGGSRPTPPCRSPSLRCITCRRLPRRATTSRRTLASRSTSSGWEANTCCRRSASTRCSCRSAWATASTNSAWCASS